MVTKPSRTNTYPVNIVSRAPWVSTSFAERGATDVTELRTVNEDVRFMLPGEIRSELAAQSA